jgi:probable F420-dependent oxidoreductase
VRDLDYGVFLPSYGYRATKKNLTDTATAAEGLGYASVWAGEHILLPTTVKSKYPFSPSGDPVHAFDRPHLDCFTVLSFLAARTDSIKLGVGVSVLPYRHPALYAKIAATVDVLSDGRLIFGAGVGWLQEEFDALGVPFEERGARSDEALEFLRLAWNSQGSIDFKGRFVEVHDVFSSPRPMQGGVLPIWISGAGPRAFRRIARFGDGWFPHVYGTEPMAIQSGLTSIRTTLPPDERDRELTVALLIPVMLSDRDDATGAAPWRTGQLAGTSEKMAEIIARYARSGVTHFVFGLPSTHPIDDMAVLAREVWPRVADDMSSG